MTNEKMRDALKEIAANENMTLLGCAPNNEYPNCPKDEQKAHEYGAYKAFNQCAAIAKHALEQADET